MAARKAARKSSRRTTARRTTKGRRKYSPSASRNVESEMRRYSRGTARSGRGGKGGKVKSRKQAIAIGLSEARKKGAKVPRKRSSSKKSSSKKSSSRKRSSRKRSS